MPSFTITQATHFQNSPLWGGPYVCVLSGARMASFANKRVGAAAIVDSDSDNSEVFRVYAVPNATEVIYDESAGNVNSMKTQREAMSTLGALPLIAMSADGQGYRAISMRRYCSTPKPARVSLFYACPESLGCTPIFHSSSLGVE